MGISPKYFYVFYHKAHDSRDSKEDDDYYMFEHTTLIYFQFILRSNLKYVCIRYYYSLIACSEHHLNLCYCRIL